MPHKKIKKVLIFSLAYYPTFVGGAEVAIKEITDRIAPEEIEFHMVTLRFDSHLPKMEKIGNVIVHRIGFSKASPTFVDLKKFPLFLDKYWFQFAAVFAALRLHRRYRFTGIWAMMSHSCGIPAGIFKTLHPEVPYLLTLQEGDSPEHVERLARPVWPLFKRGFTEADALQAISNFLLAWGERMGFRGEAMLIPNGADTAHFAKNLSANERAKLRARFGIGENGIMLVSTSRLVYKNALDDVIRALLMLPSNVHFINFGFGPDKDKLALFAQKLGVSSRVMLEDYPGFAVLPDYLHAGDIFIRPSRSEGMGISFIEAMAAELPVIATQEGGIADFLFDEKRDPDKETTGWAVDKDSPEQIASAVRDILADPEKVARVKAAAKKLVLEKYDWNLIAKQMRGIFARIGV